MDALPYVTTIVIIIILLLCMEDYEDLILQKQEEIEALEEECTGDCDYCMYKKRVPGDTDRIDREPHYYCGLFDDM